MLATQEDIKGELIEMNSTFAVYPDIDAAVLGYIKLMCVQDVSKLGQQPHGRAR